jgi:GDPmannose 4,6-dehydratase
MTKKRALVFGATGQDGTYTVRLLLKKGYSVVGTTRDKVAFFSGSSGLEKGAELRQADLGNATDIMRLIRDVQPAEIYNFAAFSTGVGMFDLPLSMGDINGLAVVRILEAMRLHAPTAKFCQASSSEMLRGCRESPQNEGTLGLPESPYGIAKLYAHNMVRVYRDKHDLFACSAILYNHESPLRGSQFVTSKIARAAARISAGLQNELLLGDTLARRDWGHASDTVRAMYLILQQSMPDDYVIATGRTHSVAELCDVAFRYVGLDWRKHVRTDEVDIRPPEACELVGDANKARCRLGWVPEIGFYEMIEEMVDAELAELGRPLGKKEMLNE